jgi:hypothetical protein
VRPDHAAARARRGDEEVARLEFRDDLARERQRARAIAGVVSGLPATGLSGRHVDLGAARLQQPQRREADGGAHEVDEAGDEQSDAHGPRE